MPSSWIDRRRFLTSGFALAGVSLLGSTGCDREEVLAPAGPGRAPRRAIGADGDLLDPPVLASVGGLLVASITAATSPVTVAGRRALQPVTYNGGFPGPTLRVRPGDWLDLTFTNRIVFDEAETHPGYGRPPRHARLSNLHYHGMHVSPLGTADNMAVVVEANDSFRYHFQVPPDHPAGLYWYHAHVHGLVTSQVSRGAAGMIYVANAWTDQLAQRGIRHRLLMLQQAYFDLDELTLISDDGNRDSDTLALSLVNGELRPEIHMRPGEPQLWSMLNASSSAFYAMRLDGHAFDVLAEDGIPLVAARAAQPSLVFPSARRIEAVVRASTTPGRYTLRYDAYDQGVDTWPARAIATIVVDGPAWTGAAAPGVDGSVALEDLSKVKVDRERRRTIVLGTDTSVAEGEFGRFTINGHAYDPAWREWTSALGTVEEWTIVNETEQEHPFHVHVNPFQVVRVNHTPVKFEGHLDTAIVPRFGSITVRTRFRDFTGGPVLMHCHILDHEDMGMMTSFDIE